MIFMNFYESTNKTLISHFALDQAKLVHLYLRNFFNSSSKIETKFIVELLKNFKDKKAE